MRLVRTRSAVIVLLFAVLSFTLLACGLPSGLNESAVIPNLVAESESQAVQYAKTDDLLSYETSQEPEYLIGPGDVLEILSFWPELNGEYIVSPDGAISLYVGGEIKIGGLTRTNAELKIRQAMERYYDPIALVLKIKSYENNQVYVLGRVSIPGIVKFKGKGTLLEALARAGVFPAAEKSAFPSSVAIIRGKQQMIWIDFHELLYQGNTKLNVYLAHHDVIYIPDPQESNVYVFGEVAKPGSYEIKNVLSVMNAIGLAGGFTEHAVRSQIKLIRNRSKGGGVTGIDFDRIIETADLSQNYLLKKNDIIFVPRKPIAVLNYYLRMISPVTGLLVIEQILK